MTGLASSMRLGPRGPSPSGARRLPRPAAMALRSAPAQNVPPAPHSTATRASASASKARKASASAAAVGPSTALRTSGRSRMTVVTVPARSTRTLTRASASAQRAGGLGAHLLHGARLLVGVALLRPRVGVHVVAVLLPEARRIDVEELEGAQPFARLPEVELGQHQAHGAAVIGGQVLAVVAEGQDHVVVQQIAQRRVRRVVGIGVLQYPLRLRPRPGLLDDPAGRDALPLVVELRPARDAVDVR